MLSAHDSVPQEDVLRSLVRLGLERDRNAYYEQPVQRIRLSSLANMHNRSHTTSALALLSKRLNITIDDKYTVTSNNKNLSWNADQNFIDFFTCVSSCIGLDACIPNQISVHNYEFQLNLRQPIRNFRSKYAQLGFDPVASILWIGRSPTAEDVWFALAPTKCLEIDSAIVPPGTCTGSTQLKPFHYRVLVFFIITMLKAARFEGLYVHSGYPDLEDSQALRGCSNFL
jgi:hypothetical protein